MGGSSGWNIYYSIYGLFDPEKVTKGHFEKYYVPLLGHAGVKKPSILEIGAGVGILSALIHERYGSSGITLVDMNEKASIQNAKLYKKRGIKSEYIVGDALKLGLDRKFDLVFSDGLIEHMPRPQQEKLVGIHRSHCKKNGFVIISAPKDTLFSRMFNLLVVPEKGLSTKELVSLIESRGLKAVRNVSGSSFSAVLAKPL